MPTNIAETIQRGTAMQQEQSQAVIQGMDRLGETVASNSLKDAGMRLQLQASVDEKATVLMQGLEVKQMNLAAARKGAQDLQDKVTIPGEQASPAGLPPEVTSAMADAQAKVRAAEIDRNDYLMSVSGSGAMMGVLKQASFMDQETAKKVFSEEFVESLHPDQQDLFVGRMTAIQQAERVQKEQNMADTAQLKGRIKGEETGAMLDEYTERGLDPTSRSGAKPKVSGGVKNYGMSVARDLIGLGSDLGMTPSQISTSIGNMDPVTAQNEFQNLDNLMTNIKSGNPKATFGEETYDLTTNDGVRDYVLAFNEAATDAGMFGGESGFNSILGGIVGLANGEDRGWAEKVWNLAVPTDNTLLKLQTGESGQ